MRVCPALLVAAVLCGACHWAHPGESAAVRYAAGLPVSFAVLNFARSPVPFEFRIHSWTWSRLALAIIGYWVLVLAAWWFYTTRPSQQARARAAAATQTLPGSRPDEQILVLSSTINITGLLAALVVPPLLLVLLRWVL